MPAYGHRPVVPLPGLAPLTAACGGESPELRGAPRPTVAPAQRAGTGHTARVTIVGVGVDVVDVARLRRVLARTPKLAERLFTDGERLFTKGERQRPVESLAARFAAKEAVAKALGAPGGLRWRDAEVCSGDRGRPVLALHGGVAEEAAAQGIRTWHLSLSHDGGIATAVVVAES